MGGHPRAVEKLVETSLNSREFLGDIEGVFEEVVNALERAYSPWLISTGSHSPSSSLLTLPLILS